MTTGSKGRTRSKTGTRRATSSKSAKKRNSRSASGTKTSTRTSKSRTNRREADNIRDNYDPSLIMFLSVIIISVIYYFAVANAGDGFGVIGTFFFGMFGFMAYVFPVAIVAGYLLNVNNRSFLIGNIKSACVGVLFIVLCTFSQLFTGKNQEIDVLTDYYVYSAEYKNGGGITGGLIHGVFRDVSGGSIWCFLLLLLLFIACFVGITGKRFLSDSKEFVVEFIENIKDGYYEDQLRREERFNRGLAKRENKQRKAEEKKELRRERRKKREEMQEKLRRERVVSGVSFDTQLVSPDTEIEKLKTTMPNPNEYGLNKSTEEITAKYNRPISIEEIKASAPYVSPDNDDIKLSFDNATAYSEMINMEPASVHVSQSEKEDSESEHEQNMDFAYEADNMSADMLNDVSDDPIFNSYNDSSSVNAETDSYVGLDDGIKIKTMSSEKAVEVRPVGGTRTYEERVFTGPNVDKVTTNGESLNPWTSKQEITADNTNEKLPEDKNDGSDLRELISIPLEEKEPRRDEENGNNSFSGFSNTYNGVDSLVSVRNIHQGLFSNSPDSMSEISLSFAEKNDTESDIKQDEKNAINVSDSVTDSFSDKDDSISKISIRRDPHINALNDDNLRREHRIHIFDGFKDESNKDSSVFENTIDNRYKDFDKEAKDESEKTDNPIINDIEDEETFERTSEKDILNNLDNVKTDIFEDLRKYSETSNDNNNNNNDYYSNKTESLFKFDENKKEDTTLKDKEEEVISSNISFSGINKPGNSFKNEEEPETKEELNKDIKTQISAVQKAPGKHVFPPLELLREGKVNLNMETEDELHETAADLQRTLKTFGVNVEMKEINQGPSITRFEMIPEEGTKVSKITKLADDIKLNMAAKDVRIEAPIPGKRAVGIELPNKEVTPVVFRELIDTDTFREASSKVSFAVGKSLTGETVVTDIAKMPHVLIAGTTGSGKSVCINTLIMSILYKARPDEVKLILVDPKVVELSIYNGIPHLLIPVVTDPKKAAAALNWACVEMDDRYQKFAEYGVRNLKGYNEKIAKMTDVPKEDRPEKMYQMVVVVDELADLMMVASKEVEEAICRLAQKARACGIHLVIATQRPSVDVITGLIKANFPSRIAFAVNSQIDSRTILDSAGAERLLGKGDMLFAPQGQKPERLQGAFIDDDEVTAVVDFLKENAGGEQYNDDVIAKVESQSNAANMAADAAGKLGPSADDSGMDELFVDVAKFCIERDKASASVIQRKFRLGWNRAARIMDQLYDAGIISGEEGTKPRRVLVSMEEFENGLEQGEY